MPNIENLTKRKVTGGKRIAYRDKRRRERKAQPRVAKIGKSQVLTRRSRGGNVIHYVTSAEKISVSTKDGNKSVKLLSLVSNPSNRDYERRGVITRGAVVMTEAGKVRVTSKPSKNGTLSGIVVS
ncbi:MAG: 30S ribosomal protein S8e [Nitrososphaerota archaeon]|nr:30S ribosomal protein S8e [Nitrososphaerota archaeon]MDG6930273.1 30S ribosomal protein S8e [Nitrososphaerota archaeon]MDG6932982.1 30S ribosomal protein S8e [Nitrososphaerota archaeon]MDG6935714.1 30S ribosomal protein S8e [Nitrososphaerota archaeon]